MSKRKCKFSNKLQEKYKCFIEGRTQCETKCVICDTYISVANKGSLDLEKHVLTEKHRKNIRTSASSSKIEHFFVSKTMDADRNTRTAEGTFAFHTIKHHQTYRSMDCTSKLNQQVSTVLFFL